MIFLVISSFLKTLKGKTSYIIMIMMKKKILFYKDKRILIAILS